MSGLLDWIDHQHWAIRALCALILALTVGIAVSLSPRAARAWDRAVCGRFR